ncbi:MAG: response regulator transcription factor [Clostridiales Family XIII bacterium]|jgi:two-component system response regulator ArlR|nr:response regulator transcription factor [Clostridiales Family XIII bacterium]
MATRKILICEDEEGIISFLDAEMLHAGYETAVARDGEEALRLFGGGRFGLVLLDLMLPLKSGLEVLREIRKSGDTPVIVITARRDSFDKVLLFKSGADDYVTKPFDTLELMARVERVFARSAAISPSLALRDLRLDCDGFTAEIGGRPLPLTKTEFEILSCLLRGGGKVLSREHILGRVYGDFWDSSNVVDVNVKNIRRKIAALSPDSYIETVRGRGYAAR